MARRRTRSPFGTACAAFAFGSAALLVGCFASIDRSKIDEGDASVGPVGEDADVADVGADDGGPLGDGALEGGRTEGGPPCTGHELCADFDGPGSTAAAYGFEAIPAGELGTGALTIESGGKSVPNCARIRTANDPPGDPGGTVGLRRSLDPKRGVVLAFDVNIQATSWQGYDDTPDFKFATVTTANDTVSLSLHIVNPRLDAGADRLFLTLADPQSQVTFSFAPFALGAWTHVEIRVAPSKVEVKVDDKVRYTHGPVRFDAPGRPYNAFVLGAIRDSDPAPAADVRIDNVVLDYL